jgi:hypothetical protein
MFIHLQPQLQEHSHLQRWQINMNKIFLILVCLTLFNFAGTPSGISLTNKIAPTDSADIFPTHNDLWGQGGFREVLNTAARDAIPPARRTMGMVVYCTADSTTYQLRGDTTNASWQIYKLGKALPDSSINSHYADSTAKIPTYGTTRNIPYLSPSGLGDGLIAVDGYGDMTFTNGNYIFWGRHDLTSYDSHITGAYNTDMEITVAKNNAIRFKVCKPSVLGYFNPVSIFNNYLHADSADIPNITGHLYGYSDSSVRSTLCDSSKNSHKADTSKVSAYATKADSSRASHISDTALHSKDTVRASNKADTVLKYINLYLGIHGTADTAIKAQRAVFSDSSTNSHKADTSLRYDNRYLALHGTADSAKGSHHLSGGNVLGDSANFHGSVIQKNGYIGIGTASPASKVSIGASVANPPTGNILLSQAIPQLFLEATGQAVDAKLWDLQVNGTIFRARAVTDANTDATDWLQVTRSGTTISSVAFPNGYVGIGTTAPGEKLEVTGNIKASGTLALTPMTPGSVPYFGANGVLTQNNAQLFWDATNLRFGFGLISADLNEGNGKLVVSGTKGTASGGAPTQHLWINDNAAYTVANRGGSITFGAYYNATQKTSIAAIESRVESDAAGTYDGSLAFLTRTAAGGATVKMIVKPNGNVGIGTSTPTSKLQVVGLPTYATNALAIAGGLTAGAFYILTGTNAVQVVQ